MSIPTPVLVATYAEIALKGKNRPLFQRRLLNNMRTALAGEPVAGIRHVESRFLIRLEDAGRAAAVARKLQEVFGIQWISPAVTVARVDLGEDLGPVCEAAVALARENRGDARNFKVDTRRSDRAFGQNSMEVNRTVGAAVGEALELPARMSQPDLTVHVLVLRDHVLVFTGKIAGRGGLPSGTSGRVACLFSGGIDSPVAVWLMMRRGCRPVLIHFFSGRTVEEADTDKIVALVEILAGFSPSPLTLYLVPAVPYEIRAMEAIDEPHDMIMFRRYMVKVAEAIGRRESCLALVTGDSLGQVASQTLPNLAAIGPDLAIPVFRPLIGLDKMQITEISRSIGAFDVSIQPYRDCCSIRSPHPVLAARADHLLRLSEAMDLDAAIVEACDTAARLVVGPDGPR